MALINVECFIKLILILSNMIYFTLQILEECIFHYHSSLDYSYVSNYHSYFNNSHAHILQLNNFICYVCTGISL
jgi:hypothetical protein